MQNHYDIIIIGNGMVGASVVCALATSNVNIAIIDKQSPLQNKPAADGRKIALSFASKLILEQFSVWPALASIATPIKQVHVSKQHQFGATRMRADELELDALGYVVPAEQLMHALHNQEKRASKVHFYCPATVTALKTGERPSVDIVEAEQPQHLTANIIIAADGTFSFSRQCVGIETTEKDYQQSALVSSVQLTRPHNNIAYQRITDFGTLALLPMQNNSMGFVCSGTAEQINALQNLSSREFAQTIEQAMGHRLGRIQESGAQYTYPIKEIIAKQQTLPGFVLIGNAAHNISPVAAQGFNLALQEVYCLVQLLQQQNTIATVLANYEQAVAGLQQHTISFTDRLMQSFKTDNFAGLFMGLGLSLLDALPTMKKKLARKSAGLNANMKRLLRDNYE